MSDDVVTRMLADLSIHLPTVGLAEFFRRQSTIETRLALEQALLQLTAVTRPHRLSDMLAEVDRREALFMASGTGRIARLEALESVRDDVIRGRIG